MAASLGKMSMTSERRLTSPFRRSSVAAPRQLAQKARPERLRLRRAHRQTQNLPTPVAVHANSDYGGDRHDAAGLAHLHVRRVQPHVGPVAFQRTVEERVHPLVNLLAQP